MDVHRRDGNFINLVTFAASFPRQFLPQHVFHVANLFSQNIQLARQPLNLSLSPAIHVVVEFAAQTVFRILPVLTHHDHRRLHRRQHRQK
jgi:hypothetical protein